MPDSQNIEIGEIETDIPAPANYKALRKALREMPLGSSRLIKGLAQQPVSVVCTRLGKGRFKTKATTQGVRVWRIL